MKHLSLSLSFSLSLSLALSLPLALSLSRSLALSVNLLHPFTQTRIFASNYRSAFDTPSTPCGLHNAPFPYVNHVNEKHVSVRK